MEIINKKEFKDCWVGEVKQPIITRNNIVELVTDYASITKGNLGYPHGEEKRKALHKRLLTESAGKPSTAFEFVPMMHPDTSMLIDALRKQRDIELQIKRRARTKEELHLRNARIMQINAGIEQQYRISNARNYFANDLSVPNPNYKVLGFRIIAAKLPYFVWMHLRTHRSFVFLLETIRKNKMLDEFYKTTDKNYQSSELCRMRLGLMGGWTLPSTWNNLIAVRATRDTQEDTKLVVTNIKNVLGK